MHENSYKHMVSVCVLYGGGDVDGGGYFLAWKDYKVRSDKSFPASVCVCVCVCVCVSV